ncbi:MAG: DegV family protein [Anaerolineales bacterium]|nr:DegV family protein [Anaerolineales bacterium]MCX7756259.1 DegV family protein [Anaerolineales bacterium]MDW8277382.1 DegV family protein [Anaerolineales bacterium]
MSVPVAVVTDSCASIPEALIRQLNIHTVAYYIHRGQEVLRDLVTIQREEFLRWLPTATQLPTTASPGPGDYLDMYRALARQGVREIISIHMTSRGSGAYQAATVAQSMMAEQAPEVTIEVVDTRNVSLCQGWMVIEAARAAIAGANLAEVSAKVRRMIPITQMIQTADTLRYLYMGGRIGLAQNLVGSLLNIKPLIGMKDGVIVALGKARSRLQAYAQMADYVSAAVGEGKARVAYVHAGALQEIEKLKQLVEDKVSVVESLVAELSPALAVHTGPGTAGLCFYPVES